MGPPSGRAQGRAQEAEPAGMNLPSTAGQQCQKQSETLSVCGKWCETGTLSPSFSCVTVQLWNGRHGMQGSGVGAKYFIKETSAVYSMRVFATFSLSSGSVLPLYTPSSQSCLRCLHSDTIPAYTAAILLFQKAAE